MPSASAADMTSVPSDTIPPSAAKFGRAVIVGCGVFGVNTAIALRRRFLAHQQHSSEAVSRPQHCYSEVVLLEASEEAVSPLAASNDLNRIVRADYAGDALYTDLALSAIDRWHDFNVSHGERVYDECGVLMLTARELESERFEHSSYCDMKRRGVPVERLRADDGSLAARFPLHAASGQYVDGYFNPRGGFVDNGRALQLLSEEAAQLGVHIRRGVQCLSLQSARSDDERPTTGSLMTSAGVMAAELIVLCCGAWTPSIVPYTSALLRPSAQPVVYLSPPSSLSSVLSSASCSFPVCAASLSSSGFYFFPLSARPLLSADGACGGRVVKAAHHGRGLAGRTDPSAPRQLPAAVSQRIVSHIKSAMPVLAECEVVAEKTCFYCDSVDGDWLLDYHRQYDNVFICAGDSGHLMKFSPVLGDLVLGVLCVDKRYDQHKQRFAWREAKSEVTLDSCRSFADIE